MGVLGCDSGGTVSRQTADSVITSLSNLDNCDEKLVPLKEGRVVTQEET